MSRQVLGHRVRPPVVIAAFAVLATAVAVAVVSGTPWWLVPVGTFGPDLSFLAAIGQRPPGHGRVPARVVPIYNTLHRPVTPLLVLAAGAVTRSPATVTLALAWLSHIVWDRAVGYGLRAHDGSVIPAGA